MNFLQQQWTICKSYFPARLSLTTLTKCSGVVTNFFVYLLFTSRVAARSSRGFRCCPCWEDVFLGNFRCWPCWEDDFLFLCLQIDIFCWEDDFRTYFN